MGLGAHNEDVSTTRKSPKNNNLLFVVVAAIIFLMVVLTLVVIGILFISSSEGDQNPPLLPTTITTTSLIPEISTTLEPKLVDSPNIPTCNKPYILVGFGCCLDKDDNSICDKDEIVTTTLRTTTTQRQTTSTQMGTTTTLSTVNMQIFSNSFEPYRDIYCDLNSTYLQMTEAFNGLENQLVEWTGEVRSIREDSSGIRLSVRHCSTTFTSDIHITLKSSEKTKADNLKFGQTVTYRAKLTSWGSFFGFEASEGIIVSSSDKTTSVKSTTTSVLPTTTTVKPITTTVLPVTTTVKPVTTTVKPTTTTLITHDSSDDSPSEVVETYFRELMDFRLFSRDYGKMYGLLSEDAKSDFDDWKDTQEQIRQAFTMQGASVSFMRVEDEEINGETSAVQLKTKLTVTGYPVTRTNQINLVKEDGKWKLSKSYSLSLDT